MILQVTSAEATISAPDSMRAWVAKHSSSQVPALFPSSIPVVCNRRARQGILCDFACSSVGSLAVLSSSAVSPPRVLSLIHPARGPAEASARSLSLIGLSLIIVFPTSTVLPNLADC